MSSGSTRTSLDTFTDEDIAQAIAEDPDTFEPGPASLQEAKVLRSGQPKMRVAPLD
jgi:hypothetical protein